MMNLDQTILSWIGRTSKLMEIYIHELLQFHQIDLTKKQLIVLLKLKQKDGLPQQELALITGRDKASLARLINTMERKNLVARIPCKEDKRVNTIYITKQGGQVFKDAIPVLKSLLHSLQDGISEEEISNTIEVIKKIQQNIILNQEKLQ